MDAPTRIRNLKKLHDDGLITNEEYEKKKAELLNALWTIDVSVWHT